MWCPPQQYSLDSSLSSRVEVSTTVAVSRSHGVITGSRCTAAAAGGRSKQTARASDPSPAQPPAIEAHRSAGGSPASKPSPSPPHPSLLMAAVWMSQTATNKRRHSLPALQALRSRMRARTCVRPKCGTSPETCATSDERTNKRGQESGGKKKDGRNTIATMTACHRGRTATGALRLLGPRSD
jgi:hypothetical protein